jgi:ribonucleoside-diphosphate reductase subunit M1
VPKFARQWWCSQRILTFSLSPTVHRYNRRVLAGEFTVVNKHLLRELTAMGLWTDSVRNRIIADGGSVQNVPEIPKKIRDVYKTVWEIPQRIVLDMAAERSPYICQSQSLNVHIAEPSTSKLTSMHFYAWKKGLKTGMYYLRTRPKADAIQFTVNQEQLVADRMKAAKLSEKENTTSSNTPAPEPVVGKGSAGLETRDEEEECLNCGA